MGIEQNAPRGSISDRAPDGEIIPQRLYRVVIVGGGFGGLYAAKALRRAPFEVVLIDRHNYHLFQPLLYQVATGALSPANIAAPLRAVLRAGKNVNVLLGEVADIDTARQVVVTDTQEVPYDELIVAAGAQSSFFGQPQWELCAPGLKSLDDATEMRRRILMAFEEAERTPHWQDIRGLLTFVVVGGGPTGVELAGALAEISRDTLRRDFRRISSRDAKIVLIQSGERLLDTFEEESSDSARLVLERLGVEVRTGSRVTDITHDHVTVLHDGAEQRIPTRTVLWAAGVKASPLGELLAKRTGCPLDRAGRVMVHDDCSILGHPEIFVIGDLAHKDQDGVMLPGVAQVAMQQAKYVSRLIVSRKVYGRELPGFRYVDLGSMATVGRAAAVAEIGRLRLRGFSGWMAWLFIHLMYIVLHENKVLVLAQWAMNYFTRNRAARLITDDGWEPATRAKEPRS